MFVHQFFKMVNEEQESEKSSIFSSISSYVNNSSRKNFYYNISGANYSLDDIKHGMLRGNKPRPGHFMRILYQQDEKT